MSSLWAVEVKERNAFMGHRSLCDEFIWLEKFALAFLELSIYWFEFFFFFCLLIFSLTVSDSIASTMKKTRYKYKCR